MKKKWREDIDEAITNVCVRIIKEPLLYFSEADIQVMLVEELRRIGPLKRMYPTFVKKGKDSKSRYQTSLIHREYGGGEGTRIDVVILDPEDVTKVENVNLTYGHKYLKPLYAFELGTEKTTNTAEHLRRDVEKLKKSVKEAGYIIHIYKDVTQARTGTATRHNTESKIKRQFKDVFLKEQLIDPSRIKVLAILLRTYRHQTKMRGKCEIFEGQEWKKVNISRANSLKNAIQARLT